MKLKKLVTKKIPLKNIPYNRVSVTGNFLLFLLLINIPIIWMVIKISEVGELVFPLLILTVSGYFSFRITKAFFHMLIKKPMIELTTEEYIDHLNGIRIKWSDISYIRFIDGKAPFVAFTLKNTTAFYKQQNGFKRLFYRFENSNANSFRTNIRFANGKNTVIFEKIQTAFANYK